MNEERPDQDDLAPDADEAGDTQLPIELERVLSPEDEEIVPDEVDQYPEVTP